MVSSRHARDLDLREISISKFKATCLAVPEDVRRTRRPVRVTRFGAPVAEIAPPSPSDRMRSWLGSLKGSGRIAGDIVGPAGSPRDWEALGW